MLPIRDMNNWVIQELLLVDLGKNDKDNNRDHGSLGQKVLSNILSLLLQLFNSYLFHIYKIIKLT